MSLQLDPAAPGAQGEAFWGKPNCFGEKKELFFLRLGQLALLRTCAIVAGGGAEDASSVLAVASNCSIRESEYLELERTHRDQQVQPPAPCRTT